MKIICLGLWKCGTKSIGHAFRLLGYRSHSNFMLNILEPDREYTIEELHDINTWLGKMTRIRGFLGMYDAFADTPFHFLYKWLYDSFGDQAKFILTLRESAEIVAESEFNHHIAHGKKPKEIKPRQYFIDRYNKHNAMVREFFKGKDNYMEYVIESNDWKPICEFLNRPIPDVPFPYRNKGKYHG